MPTQFCKRRRTAQVPLEGSHVLPSSICSAWVRLNVGGTQFEATRRTLSAFDNSFFSEYLELDGHGPELQLDFDPLAFAVVLNALRAGVGNVDDALAIVNEQQNNIIPLKLLLGYLGLEWLFAVRFPSVIEDPSRQVLDDPGEAATLINSSKRCGLFHHLFSEGRGVDVDRYAEDKSRPGRATDESIVISYEFPTTAPPDDHGGAAFKRNLMIVPWHGDRSPSDFENPQHELCSRFVLDFGAGRAVRPASMIFCIAMDCLNELDDINTLTLIIDGVSDWSEQSVTLLKYDLIPEIENGEHQVVLQLPMPKSQQRFVRMLRFRVVPPGGWPGGRDPVLQQARGHISYIEIFGDYITDVPVSLQMYRRDNFMFDSLSRACSRE